MFKKHNANTRILIVALVVASFFIGVLSTKIYYLEKNAASNNEKGTVPSPSGILGVKTEVDVGDLPVLGDKSAKVAVIEFADFQCPFCERFFKEAETNIIEDFVRTGKVKFAFRNYAFLGQESTWAAEAGYCANEQGKFWEYHDYLFNHQGPENSGAFAKDKLEGFAKNLGLDSDQFSSCLETDKYAKQVADDLASGQKAGVSGTPTTFINGQKIVGAVPYNQIKSAIEKELNN